MKILWNSVKITLAFCVMLSVCYVLVLSIVSIVTTSRNGQFETLELNGNIVGAKNVGQKFDNINYFWGRPSAVEYNGAGSGGSNAAMTNPDYIAEMEQRINEFMVVHPYVERRNIPAELLTASGSGLDPHISPESAYIQVKRVADANGMPESNVRQIVDNVINKPLLGLFGTSTVNVLELNIALTNSIKRL